MSTLEPSAISELLAVLEQHELEDGHAEGELAHGSMFLGQGQYADTGPIYPEAPFTRRFWGTFKTWAHAFQIDTDDAEVIELLTAAIASNRARFSSQSSSDAGATK